MGTSEAARAAYRPMALRIIDALAVHRLTTGGDISCPSRSAR
jgi:hypothetical protein